MDKPRSLGDILTKFVLDDKGGYITREFQDYGYRLACEMGEESKKSMYIKLAKSTERAILERARTFVKDAPHVNNPGRLFMWAVGRLKKGLPLTTDK
jgi:mannose-1-phosphate guanylyltransferase